jgi:hypothetical protein
MRKTTIAPDMCLCGCGRKAELQGASMFQLAARCADLRFPGPDVAAYMRLRRQYGYDRAELCAA